MRFAHFADVHIGSWRDPRLSDVSTKAFVKAVGVCFEKQVDFVIISGDFFNTSLPSIDSLKEAVKCLKQIKDRGIPVYAVAGSHDFSPTGKTMLEVLESAGLLHNVMRGQVVDNKLRLSFTVDEKTGAKLTGIVGKKGMLERKYFEELLTDHLEAEKGFKIFLFHTAIAEFKPEGLEKMDSTPLSDFPKGFAYYAGGHVHEPFSSTVQDFGLITYPGPLFPNNFRELEKLGCGGFYIVEQKASDMGGGVEATFQQIMVHNVYSLVIDANHRSVAEVEKDILAQIRDREFNNTIVTIRIAGILREGKPSDISFKSISESLYEKSAHFVMRNTAALTSPEFEELKINMESVEATEDAIIREHLSQVSVPGISSEEEFGLIKRMMASLAKEKDEGETTATFERRVRDDAEAILQTGSNNK